MLNSFPVFRRGILLSATEQVSPETADRVSDVVRDQAEAYLMAFVAATRSGGGKEHQRQGGDDARKDGAKRIFHFRGFTWRHGRFTVDSRISLTVCVGGRRSKIWVRLSCTEVKGDPALDLPVADVKAFFALAERLAARALRALLKVYRQHLSSAGIRLENGQPYVFSFRAFNSRNPAAERMLDQLGQDFALKQALHEDQYAKPLRDYFNVALANGRSLDSKKIIARLKTDTHEVFAYRSPSHRALYTATITPTRTDLCGFGYDRHRTPSTKSLAFATTAGLLEEYAHQF